MRDNAGSELSVRAAVSLDGFRRVLMNKDFNSSGQGPRGLQGSPRRARGGSPPLFGKSFKKESKTRACTKSCGAPLVMRQKPPNRKQWSVEEEEQTS